MNLCLTVEEHATYLYKLSIKTCTLECLPRGT